MNAKGRALCTGDNAPVHCYSLADSPTATINIFSVFHSCQNVLASALFSAPKHIFPAARFAC